MVVAVRSLSVVSVLHKVQIYLANAQCVSLPIMYMPGDAQSVLAWLKESVLSTMFLVCADSKYAGFAALR